ncbi:MAG: prepilin-type N-terminal cleavage/methylation domain-containing protein [Candidatus Firestonebacteria bacterium]
MRIGKKGYTLIELMIALGIISLILLAIYRSFSAGWMAYENSRKECEALLNARNVIKMLTRDIRSVGSSEPLYVGRDSASTALMIKRDYFKLTGDILNLEVMTYSRPVSFYWPEYFPRRSYRCRVSYYSGASALASERQGCFRKVNYDFATAPWKDEELEELDGIAKIEFGYYDGRANQWVENWDTGLNLDSRGYNFHNLLPQSVTFRVTAMSAGVKPFFAVLESSANLACYER